MKAGRASTAARCVLVACLLFDAAAATGATGGAAATSPSSDQAADYALAERMYSLGRAQVAQDVNSPGRRQEAGELMLEASRLNPTESRFPRLAGQALFDAQDYDGAIAAARAEFNASPNDQIAQVRQFELFKFRMQSVDQKIKYLEQILATGAIPAEVRAVAACDEAELYRERSDPTHVASTLDLATRLDPLDIRIRTLALATSGANWTPAIQLSNLIAIIRCNPTRADVMTQIARILASNGIVDPSFQIYDLAVRLNERIGGSIPADLAREWAAEMFIDGKTDDAASVMDHFVQSNPDDFDGWFIRLAIEKKRGTAGNYDKILAQAATAVMQTMSKAGEIVAKAASTQPSADVISAAPATAPSAATGPAALNVATDVARLQKLNNPNLTAQYLAIAGNVAWFLVYYQHDTAAAQQMLSNLEPAVPSGDVSMTRLQGWIYLISGQSDAARTKLSAVSDRDPLAQFGLLTLDMADSAKKSATTAQAKRLMSQFPAGTVGAILVSALGDLAGPVAPSPNAGPLQAALNDFPNDLLRILESPQEFYQVTAEPTRTSYAFGEPIVVKVTIRNIGRYDLFIDADGILRPDLWFDADFSGQVQQSLRGIATDRLTGKIVLHHADTISQTMRLDDGAVGAIFNQFPTAILQVSFSVMTNPARGGNNLTVPGLAGYRVLLSNIIERKGYSLATADQRDKALDALASASPAEQLRWMDFLRATVAAGSVHTPPAIAVGANGIPPTQPSESTPGPSDPAKIKKDWQDKVIERIHRLVNNPNADVRGWAMFALVRLQAADFADQAAKALLGDTDPGVRILGLVAAQGSDDHGGAAAVQLSSDPDPIVKAYAIAVKRQLTDDLAHPSTAPSGH